jgi:hypothetical protein
MQQCTSPQEELELLDVKWARIHDLLSNGMVSPEVQRHMQQTLDQIERRMLAIDPRRTRLVIAHHTAQSVQRKAA